MSTMYVPDDKYLLEKVDIKIDKRSVKKEDIEDYVKQKPNREFAQVYKFHLHIYNFSKRGRQGKLRQWTERVIGEPPVIYDEYLTDKTKTQFLQFLNNKGYYNANVTDSIKIRRKKLYITYKISLNEPYLVRNISYNIPDSAILDIIKRDSVNKEIDKGDIFDVNKLQNERERISGLLRNNGYYYLSRDFIFYQVDSNLNNRKVDLSISISNFKRQTIGNQIVEEKHKVFRINQINIYPDFNSKIALKEGEEYYSDFITDSIGEYLFFYKDMLKIKPEVISQAITLKKGQLFNMQKVRQTRRFLNVLQYFSLINIEFVEIPESINSETGLLDCNIKLSPFIHQSYAVELEGTSSSANIGFGGNLNYQHKNLFKGAQLLDINISGALQAQRSISDDNDKYEFNTIEYGIDGALHIPKFLLPINSERLFKKYKPSTSISVMYNFQERPDYTRSIANLSYGYFWNVSNSFRNIVNPIEINFVDIPYKSNQFDSIISGTYLENSYKPYFISGSSYTLVYSGRNNNNNSKSKIINTSIEFAGNMIYLYNTINDSKKVNDSYVVFNENNYAQFVKFNTDARFYSIIDENKSFAFRFYTGIGYPYGNSSYIPFIKQFYSGGANGIRAWQVRGLGPGSYRDTLSTYPNQLGDFKLEANIEYRFKMFWLIEGAVFLDAGNIWTLVGEDQRAGAKFELDRFYKELALGSGFGTRFDFSFFVFRIDLGIKLIDPSSKGSNWVLQKGFKFYSDTMWNVGIGYPF